MDESIKRKISIPNYSLSEELINSISHGVGALLSIWGVVMLLIKARYSSALTISTISIYGFSLISLYVISCIYHALSKKITGKKVLRVLDHCNVFLLVFGTVIPISLLGIGGVYGWVCFSVVAVVTLIGIILSAISLDKMQLVEVICHLVNGWSALMYIKPMLFHMGSMGVLLVILGGVMYTLGAILYGIGSSKKYMHSVFHFFCLFGSAFHFFAIYLFLI